MWIAIALRCSRWSASFSGRIYIRIGYCWQLARWLERQPSSFSPREYCCCLLFYLALDSAPQAVGIALGAGLGSRRRVCRSCSDAWLFLEPRCTWGSDLCQRCLAVTHIMGRHSLSIMRCLFQTTSIIGLCQMHGINWTVGMAAVLVTPFLFVAALPVLVLCLGIGHGIRNMQAGDCSLLVSGICLLALRDSPQRYYPPCLWITAAGYFVHLLSAGAPEQRLQFSDSSTINNVRLSCHRYSDRCFVCTSNGYPGRSGKHGRI